MLDESLNKPWQIEYFDIFAKDFNNKEKLQEADKLKIEHFPPVLGKYSTDLDIENLKEICNGKLTLKKAKLSPDHNDKIIKTNYEDTIKAQLDILMQEQIKKLKGEDPNFLAPDEEKIINESDFPFIKLMTLVYTKDTNQMTDEDQKKWKDYMNQFINQQIIFGVINTYFTVNLYQENFYTTDLQTPYNKEEIWSKYVDNKGYCATYDFKELTEANARQIQKIYPVLRANKPLEIDELEYDIYNNHVASLIRVEEEVIEDDNSWKFITNHQYTETEYQKLNSLLEPIYQITINYPAIHDIAHNDHLEFKEGMLEYNYPEVIDEILEVIESEEYKKVINKLYQPVLSITSDEMTIDFMKPEAIYLGLDFPEDKVQEFKEITEDNEVRIFQIKQSEGKMFKANIN